MRNSIKLVMPSLGNHIKQIDSFYQNVLLMRRSGKSHLVAAVMRNYFKTLIAYYDDYKKCYYIMLRNKGYTDIRINGTGGVFIVKAKNPKFRKLVAISARAAEPFNEEMAMREDEYMIVTTRAVTNEQL